MAKKILIIEDEPDISNLTKIRLEKAGYQISTAIDGKEAMALVKKNKPDLILLDLLLPGDRGEDICKKLKEDKNFKSIPIILFTASACDMSKKVPETGADDCIGKPFEPSDLIGKIKKFI